VNFINSMLSEIMFEQAPDIYASSVCVWLRHQVLASDSFYFVLIGFLDINTLT